MHAHVVKKMTTNNFVEILWSYFVACKLPHFQGTLREKAFRKVSEQTFLPIHPKASWNFDFKPFTKLDYNAPNFPLKSVMETFQMGFQLMPFTDIQPSKLLNIRLSVSGKKRGTIFH